MTRLPAATNQRRTPNNSFSEYNFLQPVDCPAMTNDNLSEYKFLQVAFSPMSIFDNRCNAALT